MIVDFLSARSRYSSNKVAVIDPLKKRQWTYKELNNRAIILGTFLRNKGITKGDRIALFAPNDIAYFDILFACTKIGAYLVPLNWRLKPIEINKILSDCKPSMIFYGENHLDRLEGLFPSKQMIDIDSDQYNKIFEESPPKNFTNARVDKSSPAFIMYTSGSTGMPKGVIITHNGLIQNGLNAISNWNLTENDITLAAAPMFHIAGFSAMVIPFIINGATVVIERYFNPIISMEHIKAYNISHIFMVPTMYYTILSQEDFTGNIFKSVKLVVSGGAPPSEFVREQFEKIGIKVINSYGLTEVGPHNFRILPHEIKGREESIGKPIMFVQAIIVNSDNIEVNNGEIGELLLSGDHVCGGYWENSPETEKAFYGKYFRTGDLAKKDEDGFFYIVNRKKELIITGGENVLPSEVEAVLDKHDFIEDSAVVGYNNKEYGESVAAMVILSIDFDETIEDKLNQYCLEHLAGYKTPKKYIFVEEFPKNSIGKIDKLVIRQQFEN